MAKSGDSSGGAKPGTFAELKTPLPEPKTPAILTPGQVVQGYEVIEQFGEGGMAIVYKARQISLNRSVAIKALHPKLSRDPEFVRRFEAESGALAALSHPNIVSIIDRGNHGDVYFFVMEYVNGETLDQKIIDNKLTPNDWRNVVSACCEALDYVHKRGVVHRDIKPSNILLDGEGRVKIADFGIAHIVSGDIPAYSGPSRAVGTQYYMAPEQIADPATVDHRADIFSLGVAFYKMFARQLPVGEFPAPSEANHEVPTGADAVIFRAMAPERDQRYATVKEFCDDLQKALRSQTMSITSILSARTPSSSALFTGADFKKSSPQSSADIRKLPSEAVRKPEETKGGTKSGAGTKAKTGSGIGSKLLGRSTPVPAKTTPVPEGGRVTASKALTPLPLPGTPGAAPAKSHKGAIAIVLLLATIGLAIIIAAVLKTSAKPQEDNGPVAPITQTKSPQQEREERERRDREQRERELLNKQKPAGQ